MLGREGQRDGESLARERLIPPDGPGGTDEGQRPEVGLAVQQPTELARQPADVELVHDDVLESELDGLALTFRIAADGDDPAVAMIDDSARAAVTARARALHPRRHRPGGAQ